MRMLSLSIKLKQLHVPLDAFIPAAHAARHNISLNLPGDDNLLDRSRSPAGVRSPAVVAAAAALNNLE